MKSDQLNFTEIFEAKHLDILEELNTIMREPSETYRPSVTVKELRNRVNKMVEARRNSLFNYITMGSLCGIALISLGLICMACKYTKKKYSKIIAQRHDDASQAIRQRHIEMLALNTANQGHREAHKGPTAPLPTIFEASDNWSPYKEDAKKGEPDKRKPTSLTTFS